MTRVSYPEGGTLVYNASKKTPKSLLAHTSQWIHDYMICLNDPPPILKEAWVENPYQAQKTSTGTNSYDHATSSINLSSFKISRLNAKGVRASVRRTSLSIFVISAS